MEDMTYVPSDCFYKLHNWFPLWLLGIWTILPPWAFYPHFIYKYIWVYKLWIAYAFPTLMSFHLWFSLLCLGHWMICVPESRQAHWMSIDFPVWLENIMHDFSKNMLVAFTNWNSKESLFLLTSSIWSFFTPCIACLGLFWVLIMIVPEFGEYYSSFHCWLVLLLCLWFRKRQFEKKCFE